MKGESINTTTIKSDQNRRLLSLDFAKGIAIILVVYGHADIKMDPAFYELELKIIHKIIYSFHLPLFFMISGALTTRFMNQNDFDGKNFIKKNALNILYPFYSLSIAFAIINVITPQSFFQTPGIGEMVKALLFMQSHNDFLPSPNLWFLFTLFSCALITYLLVKIARVDKYSLLIIAVLLQLAYKWFYFVDFFGLRRFLYNYAFYAFGYILCAQILNEKQKKSMLFVLLLFICWAAPFIIEGLYGRFNHLITGTTGSLFVIFLCQRILPALRNPFFKVINKCGENSIMIFVFHMPVYVLVKKAVYSFGLSNNYSGLAVMTVSGVVFSFAIGRIISFNKLIYRLFFWRRAVKTA